MILPIGLPTRSRHSNRRRRGFTLIEILLVVFIAFLAATVAVPSFVRSWRGAKLRASARTIVMCHRYVRSMSVLQQLYMAAIFDAKRNEIEIVSLGPGAAADRRRFFDDRASRTGVAELDAQGEGAAEAAQPGIVTELMRALPEGVEIVQFESQSGGQEVNDIYWINYYPNGMCDSYTIRLEDEQRNGLIIRVDPLSGKVEVER